MAALSEAINTFTLNVFKEISEKDSSQNVFYSPLSLYCALAMVLEGAKGNTAAQIQQVLSLNKSIDVRHSFQSFLAEANKSSDQCLLRIANRLFGEKTHDFISSFKESCQKFYHSNMEELDFANASEEARKYINKWTEEKTEGKIVELLSNDSINPRTSLVLVNAIYFKGKWEKKFDKNRTREEMFKISKEKQKPVQMMFLKSRFRMTHIEDVSTQVLVLPYVGGQMDMVILLPDENTDLKMLEQGLTPEKLTDWLKPERMERTEVGVYLPRFKLEENLDMENILQKLGMSDAFDMSKADFSGISAGKDLFLSKVSHKAFVEVNEESTEAAAATVVGLKGSCLCSFFVVDHPFLFLIRDNSSKTILFWGKIVELLSNDSINPQTSLVLVNAIYFKGKWEKKFDRHRTREEMFKISKEKQKPVQMMFLKSKFRMTHIKDVSTQVLVLPYVGGQMDMVILLPDENTDLKMLEQGLTPEKLTDWLKPERMERTEVGVYLPRFKLEENLDMENILQKLGMSDAFDMSKADFSGISAGKDLFLSKVLHKAFVEIKEEGTEAAAATAVGFMGCCLCPYFVADHPFLFLIRDNSSKTILFWGKVVSP